MCGGLGEYFEVDPVLVRVAFLLLALLQGIGILAYILMAIAVPNEPAQTAPALPPESPPPPPTPASEALRRNQKLIGAGLVALGVALFLTSRPFWSWAWGWNPSWAVALIAVGLIFLLIKL